MDAMICRDKGLVLVCAKRKADVSLASIGELVSTTLELRDVFRRKVSVVAIACLEDFFMKWHNPLVNGVERKVEELSCQRATLRDALRGL